MSEKLVVDVDELERLSGYFNSLAGSLENIENTIPEIRNLSNEGWSKEVSERFEENCNKLTESCRQLKTDMEKRKTAVSEIAALFKKIEKKNVHKSLSLGTDGIFEKGVR